MAWGKSFERRPPASGDTGRCRSYHVLVLEFETPNKAYKHIISVKHGQAPLTAHGKPRSVIARDGWCTG